jgi:peptide/nickel transport system permease protein
VLSLPTVGPLLVRSLISQDMFLAGTIVLLLGVLTVVGTLISDLVLMWVDPRIRYQLD